MIDQFTREDFEKALPGTISTEVESMNVLRSLVNDEWQYDLVVNKDVRIRIRSSVSGSGYSASLGEDSIRIWLVRSDGSPLSNKLTGRWITRVPGWEERLIKSLRKHWALAKKSGYCKKCGSLRVIRRVKKGKNAGKVFAFCNFCSHSKWEQIG